MFLWWLLLSFCFKVVILLEEFKYYLQVQHLHQFARSQPAAINALIFGNEGRSDAAWSVQR